MRQAITKSESRSFTCEAELRSRPAKFPSGVAFVSASRHLLNVTILLQGRLWMTDFASAAEDRDDSGNLIPFGEVRRARLNLPVTFDRRELDQILRVYGRMVAAGEWRDYAIDHMPDRAIFSVYRRASEVPLFQIVKNPKLARRQ